MKNKKKNKKLRFPMSMYNTPWGSLCICGFILSGTEGEERDNLREDICKKWALEEYRATRGEKSIFKELVLQDPKFIDKTLNYFGLKRPKNFPIAMVQSDLNTLFAIWLGGDILPLREDGEMGRTLRKGKIYPIDFSEEPVND